MNNEVLRDIIENNYKQYKKIILLFSIIFIFITIFYFISERHE